MAKNMTSDDINRKNVRNMIDTFNQLTKHLSSMIYFDFNGMFYLKSESTKYERIGYLTFEDELEIFKGTLFDTLALAEFKKEYRFSTSTVMVEPGEMIRIGQTEKAKFPDAEFTIKYVAVDVPYIRDSSRNKTLTDFYKKFPEILEKDGIDIEKLGYLDFVYFSSEDIELLKSGEMIIANDSRCGEGVYAYITKALFPNINKLNSLGYIAMNTRSDLDSQCAYMIFREDYDIALDKDSSGSMIIYTLISTYQSI